MNIVESWANFVGLLESAEGFQQLHFGAGTFNGDNVRIQLGDRFNDFIEFAETHMRVNLCPVSHPTVARRNASTDHRRFLAQSARRKGRPSRKAGSST
jgi:hypothetical protein